MRSLSLRTNFAWTFSGNAVYAGCQWAMLIVLAKVGTPEMLGQFALGLAVTAPVIAFASLALRPLQVTDATRHFEFGEYLGLRLITTALALSFIGGLAIVAGYPRETALVIGMVALAKAAESVSDIFHGLLQQHQRMDRAAASLLIKGPLSMAALGIVVYVTDSLVWGVVGMTAAWMSVLLCYDVRSAALVLRHAPALKPRWEWRALSRLAWLALPVGVSMMLVSLGSNIPRYFVEHHLGVADLGIFAALAYLMVAGRTVVGALGESASPRLAACYAAGDAAAFRRLLANLAAVGVLLGGAGLLIVGGFGKDLLALLYRPEYAAHVDVLLWLVVAGTIKHVASFVEYGVTAVRLLRIQPLLYATSAALTAVSCSFLVPRYGLTGAAWASSVGPAFELLAATLCVMYAMRTGSMRAPSPQWSAPAP